MTISELAEPHVMLSGRQQPRVLHRPEFDSEDDANDAIDIMSLCGQTLDPWQCLLVRVTLATCRDALAASTAGALVARQNGKGGWLEAVAVWSLFEAHLTGKVFGTDPKRPGAKNFTLWTAHELKTSDEAYLRVKALIQANDDLAAEVTRWDGGLTGQHVIELRDGSRLAFLARSKSSGRGFSPRRVIFDEAQEFSALAHRAMLYATAAQGANRQLIYTGTVPSDENDSTIWTGIRDVGRAGKSKRAAWAEWTPAGSEDPRKTIDPTSWTSRAQANPALGTNRLLHETIDAEWEAAQSDIEGFLRERMSVWPTPADDIGTGVIDPDRWASHRGNLVAPAGPVTLAIDTTVDRQLAAVVAVGAGDDDVPQVRVVKSASGAAWLPELIVKVCRDHPEVVAVVIDDKKSAEPIALAVTKALEDARLNVAVVRTSYPDMAEACADTFDVIHEGTLRHSADAVLDAAVRSAVKDEREGAFTWSRRKAGPAIVPLVAMSLGLWEWRRRVATSYDVLNSFF